MEEGFEGEKSLMNKHITEIFVLILQVICEVSTVVNLYRKVGHA